MIYEERGERRLILVSSVLLLFLSVATACLALRPLFLIALLLLNELHLYQASYIHRLSRCRTLIFEILVTVGLILLGGLRSLLYIIRELESERGFINISGRCL